MKSQKILIGFSLVLAILLIPQLTVATQTEITTPTINCEDTPYTFMYRVLNMTCFQEFLFNCSQNLVGDNSTCDSDCDCDQLQIHERIREMIQEFTNNTFGMFQFWFRHNE